MRVSKQTIVDLILSETYYPGDPHTNAAQGDGVSDRLRRDIVGAIVKKLYVGGHKYEVEGRADILTSGIYMARYPLKLMAKGNIWSALAAEFENASYEWEVENPKTPAPEYVKQHMAVFVQRYFPDMLDMPDFGWELHDSGYRGPRLVEEEDEDESLEA